MKEHIKHVLKLAFSIHGDTASYDEIHERIVSGGKVRGTNLCIMIFAIFIASIGLNMNSTAVIIGAMLISPLMGTIMAIGYGIATGDIDETEDSIIGLIFQVIVCLITSAIYFTISPITTASPELLARTTPTILDVLIAVFGGFAGIIGFTRKEKSNVIPGVAIATALMPPLCTAGYGIAIKSFKYFAGALYLFIINTYFICLATIIGLLIMKVPQKTERNDERKKKFRAVLIRNTAIIIIPSLIFAMKMVEKEKEDTTEPIGISGISLDVGKLSEQLSVIYPEVSDISAGYLKEWDSKEEKQHENMNIIVYLSKDISTEKKDKIKEFIDVETKFDKIQFIVRGE